MGYEVQQTRWDRIIRRVAGSIGPGSRVSETLSELMPVIDVEHVPGELLILGGAGIAFGGGTIQAVVGEFPTAQLFNPANSNMLITVTTLQVGFILDGSIRWGVNTNQRGTIISTQQFRDTRRQPPGLPVGQISQDSSVSLATGTNQSRLLGQTPFTVQDENSVAVLAPGSGLEIGSDTGNNTIFYSFYWRERAAEESELSV